MDELGDYHIESNIEVVLESLHEVVVFVQVHVLVLESIQSVDHVRAAGVDVCLGGLVFDGVVYVFLLLQCTYNKERIFI